MSLLEENITEANSYIAHTRKVLSLLSESEIKSKNNNTEIKDSLESGLVGLLNLRSLNSEIMKETETLTKSFYLNKEKIEEITLKLQNIKYYNKNLLLEHHLLKEIETTELIKLKEMVGINSNNNNNNMDFNFNQCDEKLRITLLSELEERKKLENELNSLKTKIEKNRANINSKKDLLNKIPKCFSKLENDLKGNNSNNSNNNDLSSSISNKEIVSLLPDCLYGIYNTISVNNNDIEYYFNDSYKCFNNKNSNSNGNSKLINISISIKGNKELLGEYNKNYFYYSKYDDIVTNKLTELINNNINTSKKNKNKEAINELSNITIDNTDADEVINLNESFCDNSNSISNNISNNINNNNSHVSNAFINHLNKKQLSIINNSSKNNIEHHPLYLETNITFNDKTKIEINFYYFPIIDIIAYKIRTSNKINTGNENNYSIIDKEITPSHLEIKNSFEKIINSVSNSNKKDFLFSFDIQNFFNKSNKHIFNNFILNLIKKNDASASINSHFLINFFNNKNSSSTTTTEYLKVFFQLLISKYFYDSMLNSLKTSVKRIPTIESILKLNNNSINSIKQDMQFDKYDELEFSFKTISYETYFKIKTEMNSTRTKNSKIKSKIHKEMFYSIIKNRYNSSNDDVIEKFKINKSNTNNENNNIDDNTDYFVFTVTQISSGLAIEIIFSINKNIFPLIQSTNFDLWFNKKETSKRYSKSNTNLNMSLSFNELINTSEDFFLFIDNLKTDLVNVINSSVFFNTNFSFSDELDKIIYNSNSGNISNNIISNCYSNSKSFIFCSDLFFYFKILDVAYWIKKNSSIVVDKMNLIVSKLNSNGDKIICSVNSNENASSNAEYCDVLFEIDC